MADRKIDPWDKVWIFLNSDHDIFNDAITDEWIDDIFAVMALCPQHTFQILTKWPKRMRSCIERLSVNPAEIISSAVHQIGFDDDADCAVANWINGFSRWNHMPDDGNPLDGTQPRWPLPNVWLGVTAENQPAADARIPDLLATPAAVRFVSCEPLLGPIDLNAIDFGEWLHDLKKSKPHPYDPIMKWPLLSPFEHMQSGYSSPGLDWVIAGGESGPHAQPSHVDWFRSLRDQCAAAGVPFLFKQWGEWLHDSQDDGQVSDGIYKFHVWTDGINSYRIGKHRAGRLLDGVEHNEFPKGAS